SAHEYFCSVVCVMTTSTVGMPSILSRSGGQSAVRERTEAVASSVPYTVITSRPPARHSPLLPGGRPRCDGLSFTACSCWARAAPGHDRDVVLDVGDGRNSPRDFSRVVLESFLMHDTGQGRPSAFRSNLDFIRAR